MRELDVVVDGIAKRPTSIARRHAAEHDLMLVLNFDAAEPLDARRSTQHEAGEDVGLEHGVTDGEGVGAVVPACGFGAELAADVQQSWRFGP